MEIRDQNLSIFYMNRIFGLAPFKLIRNQKGVLVGFRTGRTWYGYSVALITISGTFGRINHISSSCSSRRRLLVRCDATDQFPFTLYSHRNLFRYSISDCYCCKKLNRNFIYQNIYLSLIVFALALFAGPLRGLFETTDADLMAWPPDPFVRCSDFRNQCDYL